MVGATSENQHDRRQGCTKSGCAYGEPPVTQPITPFTLRSPAGLSSAPSLPGQGDLANARAAVVPDLWFDGGPRERRRSLRSFI